VAVKDRFNATSDASLASVSVRNKPLTTAQLFNISAAKTSAALDAGNADASKQLLAATTVGMKSSSGSGAADRRRLSGSGGSSSSSGCAGASAAAAVATGQIGDRRSLLATPEEEAQALRAAVLANLWSTYAITPITQADVASLLNVLVGAVDNPSEVSDASAASALRFLSTVLTASHEAGVGVSAAGAALASKALASLFATGPFDPAGAEAAVFLASAEGALSVARLVSANQLTGAVDGVGCAPKRLCAFILPVSI